MSHCERHAALSFPWSFAEERTPPSAARRALRRGGGREVISLRGMGDMDPVSGGSAALHSRLFTQLALRGGGEGGGRCGDGKVRWEVMKSRLMPGLRTNRDYEWGPRLLLVPAGSVVTLPSIASTISTRNSSLEPEGPLGVRFTRKCTKWTVSASRPDNGR